MFDRIHGLRHSIHPGAIKMYQDLKLLYSWIGMKNNIDDFSVKIQKCQQVKYQHQRLSGLLQRIQLKNRSGK